MSIVSMLESPAAAGLLITLAAQSILISILGILAMKYCAGKSAPVRSLVCSGAIAAMCLVLIASIGFRLYSIAWYKPDATGIWTRISSPAGKPSQEIQSAVPSSAQTASLTRAKGLESRAQPKRSQVHTGFWINALGLAWLIGFLLLLLKLGYGLVFLRGFRFGLVRVEDKKFGSLVKSAAASFPKNRSPELYISPKVESPITIGLLNPIVIIPEKLYGTLKDNELKSILLHELAHIYHCDHVVGLAKRIVLAAYWWNPLAYWINAEHDEAREEVSDNYVLGALKPKEYSQCLADLAEKICLVNNLPAAAAMAGRGFNLRKRVESILSNKRILAMHTSTNLKLMTFSVCAVLSLFIAGVHGQVGNIIGPAGASNNPRSASVEASIIGIEGRKLSPEQVAELEKAVAQNPDDLRAQTLLLSYYFSQQYKDSTLREKKQQTILWLIQNHPEAGVLGSAEGQLLEADVYPEGARIWKEQLQQHPNDLRLLWNAGNYFSLRDPDLAISLCKLGRSLDPDNAAAWDRQLGLLYKSQTRKNPALANEALNSLENAHAEATTIEKTFLLPEVAKAALAADQLDKAADYANQMLAATGPLNNGDLTYNGNFVLGRLAVQKGDLDAAGKYLLAAGDTTGSPVLNSFGPNMSLAKELLDRGQRDTVLAFLKKCSKFWNTSTSPCGRWIQEMEEGKTPDFTRNLNY